jgi:hypothetical protein
MLAPTDPSQLVNTLLRKVIEWNKSCIEGVLRVSPLVGKYLSQQMATRWRRNVQ